MEIIWRETALDSLEQARQYIAERNPCAAERVLGAVFNAVYRLAGAPHIGRHGRVAGTRELVVSGTPYVVAYAVAGDRLTILAIQHGARQWPESFEPC